MVVAIVVWEMGFGLWGIPQTISEEFVTFGGWGQKDGKPQYARGLRARTCNLGVRWLRAHRLCHSCEHDYGRTFGAAGSLRTSMVHARRPPRSELPHAPSY